MCTNPRQLEKKSADGSSKVYLVPCGKCAECRAKYQSEYAALSVLEANQAGSLAFLTLTYNDDSLPMQHSFARIHESCDVDTGEVIRKPEFIFDGISRGHVFSGDDGTLCKPFYLGQRVVDGETLDFLTCPSLFRSDVKFLLKRYRQDYFRRYGERIDLRFSCFGEYGEKFRRPHYHMLVYGLSRDEVNRLCQKWSFGFVGVEYVERFNADGSDAFVKVSRYVSKYVSKGDALPWFVREGLAESPRKQSSVLFGRRNLNYEHLRNFI